MAWSTLKTKLRDARDKLKNLAKDIRAADQYTKLSSPQSVPHTPPSRGKPPTPPPTYGQSQTHASTLHDPFADVVDEEEVEIENEEDEQMSGGRMLKHDSFLSDEGEEHVVMRPGPSREVKVVTPDQHAQKIQRKQVPTVTSSPSKQPRRATPFDADRLVPMPLLQSPLSRSRIVQGALSPQPQMPSLASQPRRHVATSSFDPGPSSQSPVTLFPPIFHPTRPVIINNHIHTPSHPYHHQPSPASPINFNFNFNSSSSSGGSLFGNLADESQPLWAGTSPYERWTAKKSQVGKRSSGSWKSFG